MQYLFLFIFFRMASPNTSKPPKVPLPREQRPPRPEFWPEPPVPPPEPPEDSEEEEIMCDMIKLNPLEMSNQEYIREKENKILKH